jgi:hypothetical protein
MEPCSPKIAATPISIREIVSASIISKKSVILFSAWIFKSHSSFFQKISNSWGNEEY